jgi:DNA-binding response OmpR family regulator
VRILVVCEDPAERLRVVSALGLEGDVDVVEVDGAPAARRLLIDEGARFDVLVVDGDLAPRGGFATLYDLRARADLSGVPAVPAIVLASRSQDRWLAAWAGASEVVTKPVDPFELARRATALVGSVVPPYGDAGADAQQLAAALRDRA